MSESTEEVILALMKAILHNGKFTEIVTSVTTPLKVELDDILKRVEAGNGILLHQLINDLIFNLDVGVTAVLDESTKKLHNILSNELTFDRSNCTWIELYNNNKTFSFCVSMLTIRDGSQSWVHIPIECLMKGYVKPKGDIIPIKMILDATRTASEDLESLRHEKEIEKEESEIPVVKSNVIQVNFKKD